MKKITLIAAPLAATLGLAGMAAVALAQQPTASDNPRGMCGGRGIGMGPGVGVRHGADGHGADMGGIHFLFAHRDEIRRAVVQIPGGVRTTTEADDPAVAAQLQEHVRAMYARLKDGRPINARDPLFAALFKNADKIDVKIEPTAHGLTVTETSKDANVTKLIRRHAEVVGRFIANGMHEMMQSH
jgi:hypothetical protein